MAAMSDANRCTILIVDDDPDIQEVIRVALTADGYVVESAPTARDAIDFLRSHAETRAIVLDLLLPDMNGAEFRRIQLRDRSLAWIPVIVTSAAVDGDHLAREVEAFAYVRKPLDVDELRRAVAAAATSRRLHGSGPVELATGEPGLYHPPNAC
jgi:CheY-like chemotaxis protein